MIFANVVLFVEKDNFNYPVNALPERFFLDTFVIIHLWIQSYWQA
jgi:hypothetical protein